MPLLIFNAITMHVPKNVVLLAAIAIACVAFPGCYKVYDYASHHKGEDIKQLCRVEKLLYGPGYGDSPDSVSLEASVFYNAAGNPTSVRVTRPDGTTNMDHYFRYDRQNRLTDYMLVGSGSWQVFIWHRYSYPTRSTIVDSSFDYVGLVTDPVPPHAADTYYVNIYTLDADGRVVKNTSVPHQYGETPTTSNYVYNASGNLVQPDVTYDNKVSIYRTNKVWMFVFLNYSLNNQLQHPLEITDYNQYGLPLRYINNHTNPAQWLHPFGYYYPYLRVQYACDINGPSGAY